MHTLDPTLSAAVSARDSALARVDTAVTLLAEQPEGAERAVHEARKSVKRARAMLRLVRPTLAPQVFRASNISLRDASRRLAPVRDAWVRVETLDGLVGAGGDLVSPETFAPLRDALVAHHRAATAAVLDDPVVLGEVRGAFAEARAVIAAWDVPSEVEEGDAVVVAGLAGVYAQGRRRYQRAATKPRALRLHDWRKRVKDLGYELELLTPLWSPVLAATVAECKVTWDRLGDDHDLVVLSRVAHGEPTEEAPGVAMPDPSTLFCRSADRALLDDLVRHRREELVAGALSLGARIHAEDPEAVVARIDAYLKAWRADVAGGDRPVLDRPRRDRPRRDRARVGG